MKQAQLDGRELGFGRYRRETRGTTCTPIGLRRVGHLLTLAQVLDKQRLLHARLGRNLTQADAARELSVSRSEYGRWERGLTQPRPQHLIRIARFCNCEIEDIRVPGPDGYVLTHRRTARIRPTASVHTEPRR